MAQTPDRQIFELGTSATDGVSHPLGVTIAALIKLKLLPQANIDIDARNTGGSRDNVIRLGDDDLDFGILTNLDAFYAANGLGPFTERGADDSLRLVTNLWTSGYHFIVRSEEAPTGIFDDMLNLEGKRVALGEEGSSLRDHMQAMFAALDVDIDEAYQLEDLSDEEAKAAFIEGDLDGFVLVDDKLGTDLAMFLDQAGDQARLLTLDQTFIDVINEEGTPTWTSAVVPGQNLPREGAEHVTIGMHNLLTTSEQIPEDVIYQITKTIFDNLIFLKEMHAATVGVSLETALDQLLVTVHEGAARYYREVGVVVSEPLTIPTSTLSQEPFLTRFNTIQEARTRLNEETITVLGGSAGQTTTRMISELAASLDDTGFRIVGMTNPDSADNIADVLYARGVDNALIPRDVLDYALEQNIYPDLRGKIVYSAELFAEEVHLLALDSIEEVDDLIGQPVNLGERDSPSAFTTSFLLDQLNIPVEPTYHDQRTALTMLRNGELSAMFAIAGKPMPLLSEVRADEGLHLLELAPLEGDAYSSAELAAADYPNLFDAGDSVDTFAVKTVLMSYNWQSANPRYRVLSNFINAFFDRLPALQEEGSGYHPKWRDVDPFRDIEGWSRSPAAESWIENQQRPSANDPESIEG